MKPIDFPRFIDSSVELLEPYARRYADEEIPEDPEVAAEHMAILGVWSNLLAMRHFFRAGGEVVFRPTLDDELAALGGMRRAMKEHL